MATKKEIARELTIALEEVGEIKPWYDRDVAEWVFSHPLYPVECGGSSAEEVVRNYPLYLREFIQERLDHNVAPWIEIKTQGRGGKREGAGRPKGTKKDAKVRMYVPKDLAEWLKDPEHLEEVRVLKARSRAAAYKANVRKKKPRS